MSCSPVADLQRKLVLASLHTGLSCLTPMPIRQDILLTHLHTHIQSPTTFPLCAPLPTWSEAFLPPSAYQVSRLCPHLLTVYTQHISKKDPLQFYNISQKMSSLCSASCSCSYFILSKSQSPSCGLSSHRLLFCHPLPPFWSYSYLLLCSCIRLTPARGLCLL